MSSTDDYLLIRGENFSNFLLERSTHDQLYANIERAFPDTKKRQHATNEVRIQNLTMLPYVGMKMIHVFADVTSNSDSKYKVGIQFLGVEFSEVANSSVTTFVGRDGEEYHVKPIELSASNVKVKCECLDFYWRFAAYNAPDKSLIGKAPPPYTKKTNRPPANPSRTPGVCKHIIKVVERLKTLNIVA